MNAPSGPGRQNPLKSPLQEVSPLPAQRFEQSRLFTAPVRSSISS
jgi:hypothetical protein